MPRFAICVLAIGDKYMKFYEAYFKPSHERYCKRHRYDFFVIPHFLDSRQENQRKECITYQKFLVPSYEPIQDYDYVLILDADIYILNHAGPLTELSEVCGDKVAGVDEGCDPSREMREHINVIKEWPRTVPEFYKACLPSDMSFHSSVNINSGFLLVQPKLHKEFFQTSYETWIQKEPCYPHREQAGISYELQVQNKIYICDKRWNRLWIIHAHNPIDIITNTNFFYTTFLPQTYCIHFVGQQYLDFARFLELSEL